MRTRPLRGGPCDNPAGPTASRRIGLRLRRRDASNGCRRLREGASAAKPRVAVPCGVRHDFRPIAGPLVEESPHVRGLDHQRRSHPSWQGQAGDRRSLWSPPPGAAGTVPELAAAAQWLRPGRCRRRDRRSRKRRPGAGRLSGAYGCARSRLARGGRDGRDPQPLLRLGPAGRELRGDGRDVGPAGPRHRRRSRVDVARADGQRRFEDARRQPELDRSAPPGAAGHLGGSDRDARGLLPRRPRRLRRREPAPLRRRAGRGALRQQPDSSSRPGRQRRARAR